MDKSAIVGTIVLLGVALGACSPSPANNSGADAGSSGGVVPLSVDVWDLTLPSSNGITTYFKIDWSNVNGFHHFTIFSDARRHVAQALMAAGVH